MAPSDSTLATYVFIERSDPRAARGQWSVVIARSIVDRHLEAGEALRHQGCISFGALRISCVRADDLASKPHANSFAALSRSVTARTGMITEIVHRRWQSRGGVSGIGTSRQSTPNTYW